MNRTYDFLILDDCAPDCKSRDALRPKIKSQVRRLIRAGKVQNTKGIRIEERDDNYVENIKWDGIPLILSGNSPETETKEDRVATGRWLHSSIQMDFLRDHFNPELDEQLFQVYLNDKHVGWVVVGHPMAYYEF